MTRIFKIGTTTIVEDESMVGLSLDEVRERLAIAFPEVTTATVRQTAEDDVTYIEWLPKPGRKG
jgi:hypothetical protein